MTRLTQSNQKNAISAIKDIIEMDKSRDPKGEDVKFLLESMGTHGVLTEKAAVYADDGLCHVHTKIVISPTKS